MAPNQRSNDFLHPIPPHDKARTEAFEKGAAENNCAANNIPLLQKPFMLGELKQKVRQMVTEDTRTPRAS